ncbi:hypothetical protein Y032_0099g3183 [Ancylostoma ceylanicum]|uniref:SCP domain-containing protein n=1 Tax=Ancylostoma ceylanicum TaxID=53326 RepID=A0A016TI19_9BILA|nr:hypothetical protein Y032_0099g3183 [Ancylostoma ceylanicum]
MGALLIVALLVSILPSALSDRYGKGPYCEGGTASYEEVWKVLDPIGDLRWRLVRGKQQNGPGGAKMPRPLEMREVMWKCHLEKEAIALVGGRCLETVPATPANRTELVLRLTGGKHHSYDSVMSVWTKELDRTPMKESAIGPDNVKYDGQVRLWDYANWEKSSPSTLMCCVIFRC